ncbi:hypothetical protein DMA11_25070, partial [Marinilabiliaceae bacterium JC017]
CPKNEAKNASQINASTHLLDEFLLTHMPEFPHSSSSRLRRPAYLTPPYNNNLGVMPIDTGRKDSPVKRGLKTN